MVPVTINRLHTKIKSPAYATGGITIFPVRGVAELLSTQVNFQPNNKKGLAPITKNANEVLQQIRRNNIMTNRYMIQIYLSNSKEQPIIH